LKPPPGFWVREASHAPQPPTPLSRPFWQHHKWLRVVCEELGILADTLDMREIGGWLYLSVVPLPESLVPQRIARCATVIDTDVPGGLVGRWRDEWRDDFAARIASLRTVELGALTDEGLAEQYNTALALSDDGSQVHFRLWGAVIVALGVLELTCRELLGWSDGRSLELLAGTSARSTEPAEALASVVAAADRSPDEFAAAFADYLDAFGCRALTYDLADPTLAERPDALLNLIRNRTDRTDARRPADDALSEARAKLTGPAARARFEQDLARARAAYPVREDNEFLTVSTPLALLRMTALEIGRRLTERGQIGATDDVFFLVVPEMLTALAHGSPQHAVVERRRAERAWTLANPGPPTYGAEPRLPSLDGLPGPARQVNFAFWWSIEQIAAPSGNSRTHSPETPMITGIPASAGRHHGRVTVIHDESELHKLRAGDVLVCPAFAPVWSVLLATAGALVTDQGGPLSHAAIIAREFGIPAVVATGDATRRLRDGQTVAVDGAAGTIHIG
jgi:pyruvate,water dikinase